jgi:hypothetical protein
LKPGIPSSSTTSSVAPSGTSSVAARSAARLQDSRRGLPAMPGMRPVLFMIVHSLRLDSFAAPARAFVAAEAFVSALVKTMLPAFVVAAR